MESGILALEPGKQLKESGIPQAIGILNPSSTEKDLESGNWNPESRIHDVESRIQDCLGFLYMGRNRSCTMFDVCELLVPFRCRCCSNYYWIAFRFDDEKKPEAHNPPEEAQFKILVNGFDEPLTTLKLPGPQ